MKVVDACVRKLCVKPPFNPHHRLILSAPLFNSRIFIIPLLAENQQKRNNKRRAARRKSSQKNGRKMLSIAFVAVRSSKQRENNTQKEFSALSCQNSSSEEILILSLNQQMKHERVENGILKQIKDHFMLIYQKSLLLSHNLFRKEWGLAHQPSSIMLVGQTTLQKKEKKARKLRK